MEIDMRQFDIESVSQSDVYQNIVDIARCSPLKFPF